MLTEKTILKHPVSRDGKAIVVIVGGGFGGLAAARYLARQKDVYVLLVDKKNHHLFQPLLYQVATAGLNPADIAVPIRAQFKREENVEVHWAKITHVDLERKFVANGSMGLNYDFLILACGVHHSYFGHPEWEAFAPGLKTLEQATEIRRRLLSAFERAENELDPTEQATLLTFAIVGGGPTGVELAGAIADISHTVLHRDFKRINPSKAKIVLIEAGPRLLSSFAEELSTKTATDLQHLGVEVHLSTRVTHIDEKGLNMGDTFLPSRSVFWAAGVAASGPEISPSIERTKDGRIVVDENLSLPQFPDVFVIGDFAAIRRSPNEWVPGLAAAASQEGQYAADAILRILRRKPPRPFQFHDLGQMATIGRRKAVLQSSHLRLTGFSAWIVWILVHVFHLIGFRNRVMVFLDWAWSYLFRKRGSRLMTDSDWRLGEK